VSQESAPASRHARHELRTLINHILGSSQLLLEEAEDLSLHDLVKAMEEIRAQGQYALATAGELFTAIETSADLSAPAEALAGTAAAVLQQAHEVRRSLDRAEHRELVADLEPVENAANRLLSLCANSRMLAASADPLAPDGASTLIPAAGAGIDLREEAAGGRILIVDDNPVNRAILRRRLERLGYETERADSGYRALEILAASHDVDLVLLDMMMPGMSGFEVLQRRRADPRLLDIPFIVISALDEQESIVRSIELGAEDYLLKPFDATLLRARISASLEKKRLRDQQAQYLGTIEAQAAELAELNRTLEGRVAAQVDDIGRLRRLQRFLAPQVAEAIMSQGEQALQPHRREITVAFCDLRGFTAFAETAEPEDLMVVLREYHAAMGQVIFRLEGTLEHFAGDGLMVFFNDPVPIPDPALRGVRMGLAMRERGEELAAAWRRRGHQLAFGIGIATGYATLGPIGFEERQEYAAIGSVTNLAARLSGEAGPGQILISERVLALVEDVIECEPVGELQLKGFVRPVPTYNVVREKSESILSMNTAPQKANGENL